MKASSLALLVASSLIVPQALGQDLDKRLSDFERTGPAIGDPAPGFDLPRLEGGQTSLSSLLARGPVVLEFACYSCPEAADRADREGLVSEFGGKNVQFVLVFCREEHAGERRGVFNYSSISDPRTPDARAELARRFKEETQTRFAILLDSLDNATWRVYGRLPNAAFVVAQDGSVVYREEWADADSLRLALAGFFQAGFQELKPAEPKNIAKVEEKEEPKKPDRPDRGGDPKQEWEQWSKRGERIVKEIQNLPPGREREKANRLANEARQVLIQLENARKRGDWAEVGKLWAEYKRAVERLENILGIKNEDGGDGHKDKGDGHR